MTSSGEDNHPHLVRLSLVSIQFVGRMRFDMDLMERKGERLVKGGLNESANLESIHASESESQPTVSQGRVPTSFDITPASVFHT